MEFSLLRMKVISVMQFKLYSKANSSSGFLDKNNDLLYRNIKEVGLFVIIAIFLSLVNNCKC